MIRYSLSAVTALVIVAIAAILLLAFYPSPAGAQRSAIPACPSGLPTDRTDMVCRCPALETPATVWGTDNYTDDSNLCSAAVHAGAIPASGGIIGVQTRPGRGSYTGTTRNGVSTSDYGPWRRTIVFADSASLDGLDDAMCPGVYDAGGTGWSGICRCLGPGEGPVWGSDTYTTDSDVCSAALHAGAIGRSGGVVRVTSAPGQSSYAGSTRNGVTTNSWGSYGSSFRVSR